MLRAIFCSRKNAFKINRAFGFILSNVEIGEKRYYYPSQNGLIFDQQLVVADEADLERVLQRVGETDWLEYVRGLDALEKDKKTGKLYTDHLCYFRCLARYQGCGLERKTRELASTYLVTLKHPKSFAGVRLRDLLTLDNLFDMHTLVYALGEDGKVELVNCPTDILSKRESQAAFRLNLYGGHFSYFKHMNKYSLCFTLQRCDASFRKAYRLQRHKRSCEDKVKRVYHGGVHNPSQTIFEKIEEQDNAVPPELKYSLYGATFDIEVYYLACGTYLPEKQEKLEYTTEHQLLSISVASNGLGYEEPQCFVVEEEGREAALQTVTAFVEHLERIAEPSRRVGMATFCVPFKANRGDSFQLPSSPGSVPEQEQREEEEMGESTGFDQDSDDESEEDDDEETEEDRAFIDDDDLEEEEHNLSCYHGLQLPERRRPLASPAAPVQTTNRLMKKGNDC